ncbi:hypothetical protein C9994_06480 [Marivirga lumbricoides]|uniref:RHS repeat-associated core domain-containing protein n=1 Tax=Marivirga lumbricoides TaxID=1046115 RepID=A0A2T4DS65_9BACT|nr:hypothetical protein C9994_06480 [Marivirga lumbricoides]
MIYSLPNAKGKRIDAGFVKVTEAARVYDERSYYGPHQRLELSIEIPEDGMLVAELSHQADEDVEIYFDDFSFNQLQEGFEVLQRMDYYSFGLPMAHSYKNDTRSQNRYWYNAGSCYNDSTGHYQMHYRHYDATLGRFNVVDPYANEFANLSPYNYGGNNPIMFNDPSGGRMYPNPDHLRSWRELASGGGGLGGGPMHSIGPGSNYHWSDGFGGRSYGSGGGNWTLSTGNLTVNYGDLADGIHNFGFTNGLTSLSKYGWEPNLNTPLMTATQAEHYQNLAGLGLNGSVGNGRNLYSISQVGGNQLFYESKNGIVYAGIIDGKYTLRDVINYGMAATGFVLGGTEAYLRNVRAGYAAKGTQTAQKVISKVVNPSIAKVARTAKGLGVAGVLLNGTITGVNWYNGQDVTASQVADLAIGIGLIAAGGLAIMSAPVALIAVGTYGILDSFGAFDGIKSYLGGDTVVLEGYRPD